MISKQSGLVVEVDEDVELDEVVTEVEVGCAVELIEVDALVVLETEVEVGCAVELVEVEIVVVDVKVALVVVEDGRVVELLVDVEVIEH